jgi:hypothetical protein
MFEEFHRPYYYISPRSPDDAEWGGASHDDFIVSPMPLESDFVSSNLFWFSDERSRNWARILRPLLSNRPPGLTVQQHESQSLQLVCADVVEELVKGGMIASTHEYSDYVLRFADAGGLAKQETVRRPPEDVGKHFRRDAGLLAVVGEAPENEQQLAFFMPGSFAPSRELVEFWVRGVQALANLAHVSARPEALDPKLNDVQQLFARELRSLLATIAQQTRYSEKPDVRITMDGRFVLKLQIQLCERFVIIPDETTQFLNLLTNELVTAIQGGAKIEGAWGYITVDQSLDLYYVLTPPHTREDSAFVRSEYVE